MERQDQRDLPEGRREPVRQSYSAFSGDCEGYQLQGWIGGFGCWYWRRLPGNSTGDTFPEHQISSCRLYWQEDHCRERSLECYRVEKRGGRTDPRRGDQTQIRFYCKSRRYP